MSLRDYEKALALGETCGATVGEGRWQAVCNLAPGHDLPHEQWRGCGTVTFWTWPFVPFPNPAVAPAPAPASASASALPSASASTRPGGPTRRNAGGGGRSTKDGRR